MGIIEKNGKEEIEEYFPKLKNVSVSKFILKTCTMWHMKAKQQDVRDKTVP